MALGHDKVRRGRRRGWPLALVVLVLAAGVVATGRAEAAAPALATARRSTPQLLDEAVARGRIDRATADLHLAEVFAGRGRSSKVPADLQADVAWDGTLPLLRLRQRLEAAPPSPIRARTEAALATDTTCSSSSGELPNETASTHFHVTHGTVTGTTIASYLTSLEAAYTKQVTSFGWKAPPSLAQPPPIGTKHPVRVVALSGGLYGLVSTSGTGAGFVGDNPSSAWNDVDAFATCMVLNRDFSQFGGTTQQALDATTAHEFNHSIQFGIGALVGANEPDDSFVEGAASWMEDEVFDDANDNAYYLWPNFHEGLGDYDSDSPYEFWFMLRGLTERFGTGIAGGGEQVMQDFWESTSKGTGNNLTALAVGLANKGVSLADAYHDFAIGAPLMTPCTSFPAPYCYKDASYYIGATGGLPPVMGSLGGVGASFSYAVEDDYGLSWVTLPSSGTYPVTLTNTSGGGQLRATAVCVTSGGPVRSPFPTVVGAGATTTLPAFNSTGCSRRLVVITNQQQSPGNPSSSPFRTYTLSIPVNSPPVTAGDTYNTYADTPLTVAAPGVLGNDVDPEGTALTASAPTGQTGGTVSLAGNGSFTFTPSAGFTGTGGFTYTATDAGGGSAPATVTITVTAVPSPAKDVVSVASTEQYTLAGSDGGTWKKIDPVRLSMNVNRPFAVNAEIVANADLWTWNAGFNQDLAVFVDGTLAGWKESGGFAGTFSPNAATVTLLVPLAPGHHTIDLRWKMNKPAAASTRISAGAGPSGGAYSPTRLTATLIPATDATTTASVASVAQHTLTGSDGATWLPVDPALALTVNPTGPVDAVITANADLWTWNTGFNQDLAVFVDGTLRAWKESGGFAGTFSPNAATVVVTVPLTAGSHTIDLRWKMNKPSGTAKISAGAGPHAGSYSPTRLIATLIPTTDTATVATAASTDQYTLSGSNGTTWTVMDPTKLVLTVNPTVDVNAVITVNADLWTWNPGLNQDVAVFVDGTLQAWKESGGFAGTFSPNAATVALTVPLTAGSHTVSVRWKANKATTGKISAGAGPIGAAFSPTRLTATLVPVTGG